MVYHTVQKGVYVPVVLKIIRPRCDVSLNSLQLTLSFKSISLVPIKEMLVFKRRHKLLRDSRQLSIKEWRAVIRI